jgi:hypothetical protein
MFCNLLRSSLFSLGVSETTEKIDVVYPWPESGNTCYSSTDSHGAEKTWPYRAVVQRRTAKATVGTFMMLIRRWSVVLSVRRAEMGLGTLCCPCPSGF